MSETATRKLNIEITADDQGAVDVLRRVEQAEDNIAEKGLNAKSSLAGIGVNIVDIGSEAAQAGGQVEGMIAAFSGWVSGFATVATASAAILAVREAIVSCTEKAIEMGSEIRRSSMISGQSAEDYSLLSYAAKSLGEDTSKVTNAIFMMNRRMDDPSIKEFQKGLDAIGLTMKDLKGQEVIDQLLRISDAMRENTDRTAQAEAAWGIFGRMGREMMPMLLNPLRELVNEGRNVGYVWSEEMAVGAHEAEVGMNKLTNQIDVTKAKFGDLFIPTVRQATEALRDLMVEWIKLPTSGVPTVSAWQGGKEEGHKEGSEAAAEAEKGKAAIADMQAQIRSGAVSIAGLNSVIRDLRAANKDTVEEVKAHAAATEFLAGAYQTLTPAVRTAALQIFGGGGSVADALKAMKAQGLEPAAQAVENLHAEWVKSNMEAKNSAKAQDEPLRALIKFSSELNHAIAGGMSLDEVMKRYGERALKAVDDANTWGLSTTYQIDAVAKAYEDKLINDALGKLHVATTKTAEQWRKQFTAAIESTAKALDDSVKDQIVQFQRLSDAIGAQGLRGTDLQLFQLGIQERQWKNSLGLRTANNKEWYDLNLALIDSYFDRERERIEESNQDWVNMFSSLQSAASSFGTMLGAGPDNVMSRVLGGLSAGTKAGADFSIAWQEASTDSVASMGSIAQAVAEVGTAMEAATRGSNVLQATLGGASTGASIGHSIGGGWGAAIGAGIGALVGYLRSSAEEEKELTEAHIAMLRQLNSTRDSYLKAAGGVEEFSRRAYQAGVSLYMINAALNAGTLDAWNYEIGIINEQLEKFTAYIEGLKSAGKGAGTMAEGWIAPFRKLQGELDKIKDSTSEEDILAADVIKKQLADMAVSGQASFDRLGTYAVAVFGEMLSKTGSLADAMAAVSDSLDILAEAEEKFGLKGSAALQELLGLRKIIADNDDLMKQLSGLQSLMKGLGGAAGMSMQMATLFGQDLTGVYKALSDRGVDANTAMLLMQPQLQTLWEASKRFGKSLGDGTDELLKQAETMGIVGPDMKGVQDQMLDVLKEIKQVIIDMAVGISAFGSSAKSAFNDASNAADRWYKKAPPGSSGGDGGDTGTGDEYNNPGGNYHTGGLVASRYGGRTTAYPGSVVAHRGLAVDEVPAVLQTGEGVLSRRGMANLGKLNVSAMKGSGAPQPPIIINLTTELDGDVIAENQIRHQPRRLRMYGVA